MISLRRLLHKLIGSAPVDGDVPANTGGPSAASQSAPEQRAGVSMQADAPLEDEAQDRLDRLPFAAGVADTIARRSDRSSIVIGIYAPWGDGKTTVLNWIRHRLEGANGDVVVVPFNPWLIRDELTLLPAFFATLATAVGRRMGGVAQDVAAVLKRYGGVLSGINVGVPGVSVDPGKAAEAIGTALADRTLEDMRAEFEKLLREADRRVLVIIDDVDRLDDAEIHAVFKLIKLAAAFEGITYLLAFDDDKVAAALARRYSYSASSGAGNEGGYDFLEKIVQVPLRLPKARKSALDEITLQGLQAALDDAEIEIEEADAREFRLRYDQGLSPAVTSVRIAKRFANAASFALRLLKGEAHPIDVLSIEGINACYPTLYSAIRRHPDWFLLPHEFHLSNREEELRSHRRERLDGVLDAMEPNLRGVARELIQRVFPQTESIWTNFGSANERAEWAEQQRVCSPEYFDRYFSYAVSASEISDQELSQALERPDRLAVRLTDLISRKGDPGIDSLLRSLERRAEHLDPDRATALIQVLVTLGQRVSRDSAPRFLELNVGERTARLLAELLLQLPDPVSRGTVAQHIIDSAQPLAFAAECLRWLRVKKSHTDDRRPIDDADFERFLGLLAERITDFAEQLDHPIWHEDRGIGLMYRARDGGQQQRVRRHVSKWLNQNPTFVTSLLKSAAGVAYGGNLGMAIQQDLTTDRYEGLQAVADIEDVRVAVITLRGEVPAPADFPSLEYDRLPPDVAELRMLDQFAWQDAKANLPPETESA